MEAATLSEARVYVGTYGKYNNGSLFGAWLDLSDYSDKEDFYEACRELHKDEEDAEYMFQDWENIPENLIGERLFCLVWHLACTAGAITAVTAYLVFRSACFLLRVCLSAFYVLCVALLFLLLLSLLSI